MDLKSIRDEFDKDKVEMSAQDLNNKYLWKKSKLKQFYASLKDLSVEDKKKYGKELNELKIYFDTEIWPLDNSQSNIQTDTIDFSRQAYKLDKWTIHPIELMVKEMVEIFQAMGFEYIQDLELTDVTHCFDRLRTPDRHPSRDTQDTFFIKDDPDHLLRTHTTALQPKILDTRKPPLRIVTAGKVYRSDTLDANHTPMFYQVDGFMVDKDISMANLKAVLWTFARKFIPWVEKLRFRPHYFGYTEPSMELDVQCTMCQWDGCKACKWWWWIEVLGAGMMHPDLFTYAWYKHNEYTWFAFGLWVERYVMQKYKISDIRYLYDNDMRLLKQITE